MAAVLARFARPIALVLEGVVALTAAAGGAVLILGALGGAAGVLTPPKNALAGSPFSGYLIPGLLLLLVVGGLHALALAVGLRRSPWAPLAAAVAAFGLLIWLFVQMIWIPFSPLQAIYEAAAIAELALLLTERGVLDVVGARRSTSSGERRAAAERIA